MKKSKKRIASLAIVAMMGSSLLADASAVFALENEGNLSMGEKLLKAGNSKFTSTDSLGGLEKVEDDNMKKEKNPEELVRVIVELDDKPATLLVEEGVQPTEAMVEEVIDAQEPIQTVVEGISGEDVRHNYGNLINGFSIEVKRKDIDKIEKLDGVNSVSETVVYYPDMAAAKDYTEVLEVWQEYGYKGEGLVVSVIDTGIDYTHEDMRLNDSSKAKLKADDVNLGYGKYYSEKVPFGYNFADDDDEVIDTSGSMHGMHVAGIVAANSPDDDGIIGVAPEAQVLAMKVFTNNPEISGAYTDDIIAAIEASVALGSDVINMSLGSSAGFRDPNSPDQMAIKNATDDGVICVVSAGNSTTTLDPYIINGISDTATVGSPGTAFDALQVASSDNAYVQLSAFTALIGGSEHLVGYTETDVNPIDIFKLNQELQVVDAGLGTVEDFAKVDAKGKVALVQRGSIDFVTKQLNAQSAGASAVIIYNSGADNSYINMATDPSITIPAIFITASNGKLIKDNLESTKLLFNSKVVKSANLTANEMSDFTSWGPTPDLQFAPHITAPGGSIYSTLNSDRYGSMSGTSMAAPHVAGATALIIQALKEKDITLEGRNLVEYVKKTIINTATPLIEDTTPLGEVVPYSPRRQGSGMIQTKAAFENTVLALGDDGQATLALKEIGDVTTFDITLTNYSDKVKTFTVGSDHGVLTAYVPNGILTGYVPFDRPLTGATLTFNATDNVVEVPANGTISVTGTLTVPKGVVNNNFVEGFINFTSTDNKNPDLVVPYMGYYGDWEEENIIDGMAWEDYIISPGYTVTDVLGSYYYLGYEGRDEYGPIINPNKIAISPNGDEYYDNILPAFYLLRNAKELKLDLLDGEGNLVQNNLQLANNMRRKIVGNENGTSSSVYENLGWDGTVYNKSTGTYEVAKEGDYTLSYSAKVDGGDTYQTYNIPVELDVTPVETTLLSATTSETINYNLNVGFNGELVEENIRSIVLELNGEEVDFTLDGDKLASSLNLIDNKINLVTVGVMDNAGNITETTYEVGTGKYKAEVTFDNLTEGSEYTTDVVTVTGSYIGDLTRATVNGVEVDSLENGLFTTTLNLNQGKNTLKFEFFDSNGNLALTKIYRVYCYSQKPVVELQGLHLTPESVHHTATGIVPVRGRFYDPEGIFKVRVNGVVVPITKDTDSNPESLSRTFEALGINSAEVTESVLDEVGYREFYHEVVAGNGDIINVNISDDYGNKVEYNITVVVDESLPTVEVNNLLDGETYNTSVTPELLNLDKFISYEAALNGLPYNFKEISEEGSYELVVKVVGLNSLEAEKAYKFVIDKTNPKIVVNNLVDGGLYNTVLNPEISYSEDVKVSLLLNGEAYNNEAISEDGEYSLIIVAVDKAGNISTSTLNFTIDTVAPEVTTNVVNGMKYEKSVEPKFTSNKDVVYTMILNNEVYDGTEINKEGSYTLVVEARDGAGNVTVLTRNFEISFPKNTDGNENPTPTPTPNPDPKDELPTEDDKEELPSKDKDKNNNEGKPNTSLNNGANNNSNTGKPGKGNLPETGGTNTPLVFSVASLLTLMGFVLYKKKENSNIEESNK